MPLFLVLLIYNALLPVVLLLGFPTFIIKGIKRGGLARNFAQRFGFYSEKLRNRLEIGDSTWVHAVSVGEIMVAMKLIRELAKKEPDRPIVLSTTTTTGYRVALEHANPLPQVSVIYSPVDLPGVVHLAVRRIRPHRLVLVEAEVWPNLTRLVRKLGAPVILTNARLSDRSERRFKTFGAVTIPIFQQLDHVCVPFAPDVERWRHLGVDPEKITLTGSVKFDSEGIAQSTTSSEKTAELIVWLSEVGLDPTAPILLGASTHPGEEALIGQAWKSLAADFPNLQYVAVPRHAERAREVDRELRSVGLKAAFRVPVPNVSNGDPDCAISNTTGELGAWFHLASVVVVGKSLLGKGGQNPVEPIATNEGKPTIVGPHMQNFRDIVNDLKRAGGIVQLQDADELTSAIRELLEHPAEATRLCSNGQAVLETHQGAAIRTVSVITATS